MRTPAAIRYLRLSSWKSERDPVVGWLKVLPVTAVTTGLAGSNARALVSGVTPVESANTNRAIAPIAAARRGSYCRHAARRNSNPQKGRAQTRKGDRREG